MRKASRPGRKAASPPTVATAAAPARTNATPVKNRPTPSASNGPTKFGCRARIEASVAGSRQATSAPIAASAQSGVASATRASSGEADFKELSAEEIQTVDQVGQGRAWGHCGFVSSMLSPRSSGALGISPGLATSVVAFSTAVFSASGFAGAAAVASAAGVAAAVA